MKQRCQAIESLSQAQTTIAKRLEFFWGGFTFDIQALEARLNAIETTLGNTAAG